jgi:DNA-binding IclR family transcriptional regulator
MDTVKPEGSPETEAPKPRVQSAARTIGILLAIAQTENGLTTKEISEQVNIGRQATYHLLHTLTATGMVARDDGGRYVLGLRVSTLAEGFSRQLSPSEHLAPIVRAVAHETGETSYASGWRDDEIMTLSFARGTNPLQAAELPAGYIGDGHARASGKLLLAMATPSQRETYLTSHEMRSLTPSTITDPAELELEFEKVREQGYALDREEFSPGLSCLAVPFDRGYSPFALAASGPSERVLANLDQYLGILRRAVSSPPYDGLSTKSTGDA